MTPDRAKRLAQLVNERTAYEIAINATDGRRFRICYSERRTVQCLLANMRAKGAVLATLIDDEDGDLRRAGPAYVAPTWRIGYTGRTQRQAIQEGELPPLSAAGAP